MGRYYADARRIMASGSVSDPRFVRGEYASDEEAAASLIEKAIAESKARGDFKVSGGIRCEKGHRAIGTYHKVFNASRARRMESRLSMDEAPGSD